MNSNRIKAAWLALLLFGLGCAVGVLGQRYYDTKTVAANTAKDFRQKYISEMKTKLNLSQHQIDELQVILDDTKAKVKAMRETQHPEIVQIKDDQLAKVKSILSPDQAKKYEAIVADREQQAKEQEDRDRQEDQRLRELHLKALAGK